MIFLQLFFMLVAIAGGLVAAFYRRKALTEALERIQQLKTSLRFRMAPIPEGTYTTRHGSPFHVDSGSTLGYNLTEQQWELHAANGGSHGYHYTRDILGFYPVTEPENPYVLVDGVD